MKHHIHRMTCYTDLITNDLYSISDLKTINHRLRFEGLCVNIKTVNDPLVYKTNLIFNDGVHLLLFAFQIVRRTRLWLSLGFLLLYLQEG